MLRTFLISFSLFLLAFGGFVLWLFMALSPSAVEASATQCGPRDRILAQLASRYDEDRRGAGMAANGMMVELFASTSGSWTFTVTTPQGQTCLLASGQNWEALPPPPKGTEG